MYKLVKSLIPSQLRNKLIDKILNKKYDQIIDSITNQKDESLKRVFIMGTPEHGNLGDHAIIEAEVEFFHQQFPEYKVFEIPFKMVSYKLKELKEVVEDRDLVVVTGGGYMGTLWPKNEEFVRGVINNFTNNKVIVFPQTAYYDDSNAGKEYLNSSIQIYNKHNNLYLTAREKKSFELFETNYDKANNLLTPDIVLFLNKQNKSITRDGVLICLRKDREKISDDSIFNRVSSLSKKSNLKTTTTDTVINRPVFNKDRSIQLEKKLNEFRDAKIVVTDRLHGMIFAAITGTPCIAFDNKTGKVKGVYDWIKSLDYIILQEDTDSIEESFNFLYNLTDTEYKWESVATNFQPLISAITED